MGVYDSEDLLESFVVPIYIVLHVIHILLSTCEELELMKISVEQSAEADLVVVLWDEAFALLFVGLRIDEELHLLLDLEQLFLRLFVAHCGD